MISFINRLETRKKLLRYKSQRSTNCLFVVSSKRFDKKDLEIKKKSFSVDSETSLTILVEDSSALIFKSSHRISNRSCISLAASRKKFETSYHLANNLLLAFVDSIFLKNESSAPIQYESKFPTVRPSLSFNNSR